MTHAESIEMFKSWCEDDARAQSRQRIYAIRWFYQQDYAQKMLDEYTAAGVDASQVFLNHLS